jgi:hypothetical protein
MHDFWLQALNNLVHHSRRSLDYGYTVDDQGTVTFALGPSTDLVPLALGFAFWTYLNMVSLTVEGDDLVDLSKLGVRHGGVMPDAWLRRKIAEAADEAEGGAG